VIDIYFYNILHLVLFILVIDISFHNTFSSIYKKKKKSIAYIFRH